ncbi:hypothetical protein [Brachybacterium timonense]|uniref:hypothetical protein n=1 Tax=Brachybacterium timonense TaxID=2050896 RepID=UPI000D0AE2FA|nr:hypothetical protein [Brachybacterium timonense]
MTTTEGAPCCADHDHTGHDHAPSGADLVQGLIRGLSLLALLIPVLALALVLASLAAAPTTPLPLLVGLAVGGFQLLFTLITSLVVTRMRVRLVVNPGLLAFRSGIEEALRVGAVLLAYVLWPLEDRGPLGLWVGLGAALAWLIVATVQTISTRRRLATPSLWGKEAVATLLTERVSARSTVLMRLIDVLATALFQIGATMLVCLAPMMVIGTFVLSFASSMATLMLQRRSPATRSRSAWAYAPLALGALTLALALLGMTTA